MILEIDEQILRDFPEKNLKVYFYQAGCEGTKIHITWDFQMDDCEFISLHGKNIYFEAKQKSQLDGGKILKKTSSGNGHTSYEKYIFISPKVQSRCGCATSFSFDKKLIDTQKLKTLQGLFKK